MTEDHKRVLAMTIICAIFFGFVGWVCFFHIPATASGQHMSTGGGRVFEETATKPATQIDGYTRTTDYEDFIYSPSMGKYLGPSQETMFSHQSLAHAGALLYGGSIESDTTQSTEDGIAFFATHHLVSAEYSNSRPSSSCSVYVYKQTYGGSPASLVVKLPIVAQQMQKFMSFDSTVTVDSGQVVSAFIVTGGLLPNRPVVRLHWREVVTP